MHALLNAPAVFAPMAWQLLAPRHLARPDDATPADRVLAPLEPKMLEAPEDTCRLPLERSAWPHEHGHG